MSVMASGRTVPCASGRASYTHAPAVQRRLEPPSLLWCEPCRTVIDIHESVATESERLLVSFGMVERRELVLSTSRPELLAACAAICVHPRDERHIRLLGARVTVPVFGHSVPVWPTRGVDQTRDNGMTLLCTFGSLEDVALWRSSGLDARVAVNADGRMNELAGEYAGMSVSEARSAVTRQLRVLGLVVEKVK